MWFSDLEIKLAFIWELCKSIFESLRFITVWLTLPASSVNTSEDATDKNRVAAASFKCSLCGQPLTSVSQIYNEQTWNVMCQMKKKTYRHSEQCHVLCWVSVHVSALIAQCCPPKMKHCQWKRFAYVVFMLCRWQNTLKKS